MADTNTIARIGGILKNTYGPDYIVDQQNKIAQTRKKFSTAAGDWRVGGDHYEFPAKLSGNRASVQAQNSDDALATPSRQTSKKFQVFDRMYTAGVRVFWKDMQNSKSGDKSFVRHLDDEVNGAIQDTTKVINQDIFGDGTGTRGTIASGTASATQTLTVGTSFGQFGSKWLVAGDLIDIYDSTLTTSRTSGAGVTINSITPSSAGGNASVVLSGSVTTTTGDIVVLGKTGPNKAYIGLWSGTNNDTGTFQGLSRSTFPILKGNVLSQSGNPLVESMLLQLLSKIEIASGETPQEFRTGQAQFDAYAALGFAQKRFTDNTLDKGFQQLDFNGIPFVKDVDAPPAAIFALNFKYIQMGLLNGQMDWMDDEGQMLKWDAGFAAYKAVLVEAGNICYTRPNALGRLDGLAVGATYQI